MCFFIWIEQPICQASEVSVWKVLFVLLFFVYDKVLLSKKTQTFDVEKTLTWLTMHCLYVLEFFFKVFMVASVL